MSPFPVVLPLGFFLVGAMMLGGLHALAYVHLWVLQRRWPGRHDWTCVLASFLLPLTLLLGVVVTFPIWQRTATAGGTREFLTDFVLTGLPVAFIPTSIQYLAVRRAFARDRPVIAVGFTVAALSVAVVVAARLGGDSVIGALFLWNIIAHSTVLVAGFRMLQRDHAIRDGITCAGCGYDIRLLTSRTCPECATPLEMSRSNEDSLQPHTWSSRRRIVVLVFCVLGFAAFQATSPVAARAFWLGYSGVIEFNAPDFRDAIAYAVMGASAALGLALAQGCLRYAVRLTALDQYLRALVAGSGWLWIGVPVHLIFQRTPVPELVILIDLGLQYLTCASMTFAFLDRAPVRLRTTWGGAALWWGLWFGTLFATAAWIVLVRGLWR